MAKTASKSNNKTNLKNFAPLANLDDFLKRSIWTVVLDSLATIILGILFVVWPEVIVLILAYLVGTFFIMKGLFSIINYFVSGGHRNFFNNDLLNGVIAILIGVALFIIGPANASQIFRIIVGIWIIYDGLVRANLSLKLKVAKTRDWTYLLLVGLLMVILGFVVIFTEGSVVTMVGWILVASGLVGIASDVLFVTRLEELKQKLGEKFKS